MLETMCENKVFPAPSIPSTKTIFSAMYCFLDKFLTTYTPN
jgi:hypothetical protein